MSKVGGTYPSVIQGVSEKPPHTRRPGQTSRQVNMLSDPVYGLIRRRGSRWVAKQNVTLSPAIREELAKMDVFDFVLDGKEYALLYRRFPSALSNSTFAFLYCKTDEAFIPINYEASSWVSALVSGGASSVAAIGSHVYISGNTTIPAATQVNLWDTASNHNKMAAWIRTGKFNTTYRLSIIKADGTRLTKEYKTKPAAYPGVLDTSGIAFFESDGTTPRPEYQKDVNDAVNAFNSATNAWIVESTEDIVPENIAAELTALFALDSISVTNAGGGSILFNDPDYVDIEMQLDDSDTDDTVFTVGKTITDPTLVTKYHFDGKIVRVQPRGAGADEAYYLEARLDDPTNSDGYGAVSWFECAGVTAEVTNLVSQMIVWDGQAYIARNGDGLTAMAPASGEHPDYKVRVVGDGITSPLPWFIGKVINALAVFQDRLIVCSDNYVSSSKSGDYLNFFRASVLNIADDDPVEVFAHGSEGDTLRSSVVYNGNLLLFGDSQQYGISGEALFTPRQPLIRAFSANKDATYCKPVASGNFVFYTQYGADGTSMHQMRVGALNGQQTVTSELSEDIGDWLTGQPLQVVALTAPNFVMLRNTGHASDVYLFGYVDDSNTGERRVAAWHSIEYASALGTIIGISSYKKAALVFTARSGSIVCDSLSLSGAPDNMPCMDSTIPNASASAQDVADADTVVVVGPGHEAALLGTPFDRLEEFLEQIEDEDAYLWRGVVSPAVVVPTNPFPRDQNGNAIMEGRMTLTHVGIDVVDTGGLVGEVSTKNGVVKTLDFEGRILGSSSNLIGRQPLFTGTLTLGIGREVRDCEYSLGSKDWLPLRISGIGWAGQTFNNTRRVS